MPATARILPGRGGRVCYARCRVGRTLKAGAAAAAATFPENHWMKLRYRIALGLLVLVLSAVAALALTISYDASCPSEPLADPGETSMRAVIYRCYGSPDVLELVEIARPVPADNEVLVRVHAAGVNPYDWHFMRGSPYFMRLMTGIGSPEDRRLGVDFAGTVESVGADVTRFRPGDEVFGGATGAFADYVTVADDGAIAHKPARVSFDEAAGVGIAGVTALQALRDAGGVKAGEKVLINGASGGVGTFAVQIARRFGADVSGVCSTRNVDMVRRIGADRVFDYKKENYTEGDHSFDLIVDMVGNHPPSSNLRVLSPDGTLVLVGGPSGDWIGPLMPSIKARLMSPFVDEEIVTLLARLDGDDFRLLADLMEQGAVTPQIDRRYRLDEIAEAITYSESGRARGKIIINVTDSAGDPGIDAAVDAAVGRTIQ